MSFITEWFAKCRVLNKVAGHMCGCKFFCSVLQPALQSNNRLTDAFPAVQRTEDKITDISRLKDILTRSATIHDARDHAKHTPGLRRRANMTTLNDTCSIITEIIDTSEPEVADNICACALHRTQRQPATPAARIWQDIYDQFDPAEQSLWQDMPEAMRVKISREIPASVPTEFPTGAGVQSSCRAVDSSGLLLEVLRIPKSDLHQSQTICQL